MNDSDIATMLREAPAPSMSIDPSAVTAGAHRRVRERRQVIGAGIAAAVLLTSVAVRGALRSGHDASYRPAASYVTTRPVIKLTQPDSAVLSGNRLRLHDHYTYTVSADSAGQLRLLESDGKTALDRIQTTRTATVWEDAAGDKVLVMPVDRNATTVTLCAPGPLWDETPVLDVNGQRYVVMSLEFFKSPPSVTAYWWNDRSGRLHNSLDEKPSTAVVFTTQVNYYPRMHSVTVFPTTGTPEGVDPEAMYGVNPEALVNSTRMRADPNHATSILKLLPAEATNIQVLKSSKPQPDPIITKSVALPGTSLKVVAAQQVFAKPLSMSLDSGEQGPELKITWTDSTGTHTSGNGEVLPSEARVFSDSTASPTS